MADSQFDQYPQEPAGRPRKAHSYTDRNIADQDITEADSTPFHCREPMSLVAPEAESAGTAHYGQPDQPDGHSPTRVLRCRCGFQMDAPAGA
jgi:hypothetical protein